MKCIFQNSTSTDKQRRRGVAPSPEPESTERSAAPLFQEATTVNLQMKLLSQDKIRRRQSKKYRDLQEKIMKIIEFDTDHSICLGALSHNRLHTGFMQWFEKDILIVLIRTSHKLFSDSTLHCSCADQISRLQMKN